jgi:hypothetical protein
VKLFSFISYIEQLLSFGSWHTSPSLSLLARSYDFLVQLARGRWLLVANWQSALPTMRIFGAFLFVLPTLVTGSFLERDEPAEDASSGIPIGIESTGVAIVE